MRLLILNRARLNRAPDLALLSLSLALPFLAAAPARAAPILVLSSPDNLSILTVGQQVVFNVSVQGLPVPSGSDFLFVLNSQVQFSGSSFSPVPDPANSSGLTPGAILSLPSQRSNFNALSSLTASSATGNFRDSFPAPSPALSQNGLYYSFVLQAAQPGTGLIQFNPAVTTYAANSTGFSLAPMPTGGPLAFVIAPAAPSPVPEPGSTISIALMAATTLMAIVAGRRRLRCRRVRA